MPRSQPPVPPKAQRLYNDRRWPNPVVIRITDAEAGLRPPTIETLAGDRTARSPRAMLNARLTNLGEAASVDVGFQYRRRRRTEELYGADQPWRDTPLVVRSATGEFSASIEGLDARDQYEFRAVVRHPLLTIYGEEKPVGR